MARVCMYVHVYPCDRIVAFVDSRCLSPKAVPGRFIPCVSPFQEKLCRWIRAKCYSIRAKASFFFSKYIHIMITCYSFVYSLYYRNEKQLHVLIYLLTLVIFSFVALSKFMKIENRKPHEPHMLLFLLNCIKSKYERGNSTPKRTHSGRDTNTLIPYVEHSTCL